MTETQLARIARDLEHLRELLLSACASPLVWLPLLLCAVVGGVFLVRWFSERHHYSRVGRNASLACLGLASAILVIGTWSQARNVKQPTMTSTVTETVTTADTVGRG